MSPWDAAWAPKVPPSERADGNDSYRVYRVRIRADGRQTTETCDSTAAAAVFVARVNPALGPERAVMLRGRR
jgi:hypothetical protein